LLYSKSYLNKRDFLNKSRFKIRKLIYIGDPELRGIEGFASLNLKLDALLRNLDTNLNLEISDELKSLFQEDSNMNFITTGIGSSESHANYLVSLM
jgi:hypothetical protein